MDTNNGKSAIGSGRQVRFTVFLASPGDVPLERKLARETIAHVSSERRFRGRIDIDIVAWDQPGAAVAMEAGLTPQEAIAQGLPKPEDCDLAVVVLWSRIGTQLPRGLRAQGRRNPLSLRHRVGISQCTEGLPGATQAGSLGLPQNRGAQRCSERPRQTVEARTVGQARTVLLWIH